MHASDDTIQFERWLFSGNSLLLCCECRWLTHWLTSCRFTSNVVAVLHTDGTAARRIADAEVAEEVRIASICGLLCMLS